MTERLIRTLSCALCLSAAAAWGQTEKPAGSDSAEDLFALDKELQTVTITSKTQISVREAPGMVTVITREEIKRAGFRDLRDILLMVPGFQIASDYNGTMGIGFRGLWGLEGKVLLMLDGLPLNDLHYDSAVVDDRIPVEEIERVEIVRGPGSAVYGGAAEYAAINVITQTGAQLHGARVSLLDGELRSVFGHRTATAEYGQQFGTGPRDLDISAKLHAGVIHMGDDVRVAGDGTTRAMTYDYEHNPLNANIAASFAGVSLRLLVDRNRDVAPDYGGSLLVHPLTYSFDNYIAVASYAWQVTPKLTVTPSYSFKQSRSYYTRVKAAPVTLGEDAEPLSDYTIYRNQAQVVANAELVDWLSLLLGVEASADHGLSPTYGWATDPADPTLTSPSIVRRAVGAFVQAIATTSFGDFTLGGRYELHDVYGSSAVPRFAYTKAFERVHFKVLLSRAFRTPSIGNLDAAAAAGVALTPEYTNAAEAEVGYRFDDHNSLVANAFYFSVDKPITYIVPPDVDAFGSYQNFGKTGSRGFELEYRLHGEPGFLQVNYSYYNSRGQSTVPSFADPARPSQLLGFSPHKLTLMGDVKLVSRLHLGASFVALGERPALSGTNYPDALPHTVLPQTFNFNLNVTFDDAFIRGLDLAAGLYNVTNTRFDYPTAYDLGENPLPGPGREVLVRLTYHLDLTRHN